MDKFRWWFAFTEWVFGNDACMTEVGCGKHHLYYKVLEAGNKYDVELVSFGIISSKVVCAVVVLVVAPGGGLVGSVVAILLGKGGFAICYVVVRRMSEDFAQADGMGSLGSHGSSMPRWSRGSRLELA